MTQHKGPFCCFYFAESCSECEFTIQHFSSFWNVLELWILCNNTLFLSYCISIASTQDTQHSTASVDGLDFNRMNNKKSKIKHCDQYPFIATATQH